MSFHIFTIAASSSVRNILSFFIKSLLLITTLLIIPGVFVRAANAEQEKAFVAKYKTALEANDRATLQSVLYTTQSAGVLISLARREV
jgi:hypothetical protein